MGRYEKVTANPGDRFGKLTVVGEINPGESNNSQFRFFKCVCDCGKEKIVKLSILRMGEANSCGCSRKGSRSTKRSKNLSGIRPKDYPSEYISYRNMINRCYNETHKGYRWYGSKGKRVCDEWLMDNGWGFANFIKAMGQKPSPKHQLDRIDPFDDLYHPENCRWALPIVQQNNKTNNVRFEPGFKFNAFEVIERLDIENYRIKCICGGERLMNRRHIQTLMSQATRTRCYCSAKEKN